MVQGGTQTVPPVGEDASPHSEFNISTLRFADNRSQHGTTWHEKREGQAI